MEKIIATVGSIVLVCLIVIGVAIVMAIPTYFLWNWLMPLLFNLPAITLVQAWGINFLAAILFKSNSTSSKSE